jgi:alpha-mannosidase
MWIWDWDEGMHEVLQTFRAAVERLDEDPDLRFTASSSSYYRWVMETSPDVFARIRELVSAGRWVVTGGQWVEPDCNLPSGESVCRQLLYGQRFLAEHLGVTATVGYNVDSFGHAGTLPQLLAASGISAYVCMRPGPGEKSIPSPAFRWRGTDGTELPAYRIPFDYSTRGGPEDELLRVRADELLALGDELGIPLMVFFGVGDHGGGPTRLAMATGHALAAEHGGAVAFGDPEAYFEALGEAPGGIAALPAVDGELQWHAVGCYSARAGLKLANARAEDALVAAEALTEVCRLLTGDAADVRDELADAWRGVLFAQFHDALGGTCTDGATEAVHALLVSGAVRAEQVAVRAAHRLAEQVDTWVEGAESAEGIESAIGGLPIPMLVCNPHSWSVTTAVSLPHPIAVATDADGRRVRVQQVPSGEVTYSPTRSLLQVTVPPLGYRRYWLHVVDAGTGMGTPDDGTEPAPAQAAAAAADDAVLTNGLVRLRVDRGTGALVSVRAVGGDLAPGTEVLRGGVRPVLVVDDSDTWSHGIDRYDGATEEGRLRSVDLVEAGPVRATVRSVWSFGNGRTTVAQDVSLYEGRFGAEVSLDIDWHEAHRVLKLVVPVALDGPTSTAGAPYGSVERPCSGHEEPMVHWVDLFDAGAGWGLACATESAGGYDALGSTLRLTVLRSPRVADHGQGWGADPVAYPITDHGRHRVRYALVPHALPAGEAQLPRRATEHRATLPVVLDTWHRGRLGPEGSAARLEGEGVVVPVLKRAENGGGTVARLWEVTGARRHVRLSLGAGPDGPHRAWEGELGPHQVRTIFLPDTGPAGARAVDIPELDVCPPARGDFAGLLARHPDLSPVADEVQSALALLARTVEGGGTVYVGGNGGSAADAEHIVGELMKGMEHRRPLAEPARRSLRRRAPDSLAGEADYLADRLEGALRAVCLTSQSGLLSAIANDTAGDMGMAQQIHGYGRPGDLFWALSTSGRSRNVVLAALAARAAGVRILALTGAAGDRLGGLADVWVAVPATDVAAVQELHQPIYHALCAALEERYWPEAGGEQGVSAGTFDPMPGARPL